VRVYYWNYTTGTLNGDLADDNLQTASTVGCTALDLSPDERFAVVGYSNGAVYSLIRNAANNTYTNYLSTTTNANSVTDLRVFDDDYVLVCRSSGAAGLITVDAAGTAQTETASTIAPTNCQSIDVRLQSN